MPRDGAATRQKILDAAHALVLGHGFGATSVDKVIAKAGVTKGAFFYHFATKTDLAHALVARYVEDEDALVAELLTRAEHLARDPLQQLLVFVGLFVELFEGREAPQAGCLLASFCYASELVDDSTRELIQGAMVRSRELLQRKLERAAATHPPRREVELDAIADQFLALIEGGFVLERAVGQPRVAAQLRQYRSYLELLFDA
jgi:TetR/AcrR family transcriptional regulator, transcriptional repressor for nem operon